MQDELFGEIRGLLEHHSPEHFEKIIRAMLSAQVSPEVLTNEIIPYVQERLKEWPSSTPCHIPMDLLAQVQQAKDVPYYKLTHPVDVRLLGDQFIERDLPRLLDYDFKQIELAPICAAARVLENDFGLTPRHVELNAEDFTSFFPVYHRYKPPAQRASLKSRLFKRIGVQEEDTSVSELQPSYYNPASGRHGFFHHGSLTLNHEPELGAGSLTITGDLELTEHGSFGSGCIGVGGDVRTPELAVEEAWMVVEGTIKTRDAWINFNDDFVLFAYAIEADLALWYNAAFHDTSRVKLPIDFEEHSTISDESIELLRALLAPELVAHMQACIDAEDPEEDILLLADWIKDDLMTLYDRDPASIWAQDS